MTYTKHSSRSPEEIEQRLREAAQRHKFGVLHVHDLKKTLELKGIELGAECRVFDVCNPQAATTVLRHEMKMSAVLPCRISVFTDNSGCTIATVNPSDLMRATGLSGAEDLAAEIDLDIRAIIDEAA